SKFVTFSYFCSQSIRLLRCRWGHVARGQELPLADRMHDFDARDRTACCPKGLEAEQGTCEAFHCPMVLFHDVMKILGVADDDGRLVNLLNSRDRGCVGPRSGRS